MAMFANRRDTHRGRRHEQRNLRLGGSHDGDRGEAPCSAAEEDEEGKGEVMTYKKVIDAIGGGVMREAARRLGISHNTVYGWSRKGMVPECRVDQVREVAKKMGVKIDD